MLKAVAIHSKKVLTIRTFFLFSSALPLTFNRSKLVFLLAFYLEMLRPAFSKTFTLTSSIHSKKSILKCTKYLGSFGAKTLGKFSKPVCIFLQNKTHTSKKSDHIYCKIFWSWSYQKNLLKFQMKYEDNAKHGLFILLN